MGLIARPWPSSNKTGRALFHAWQRIAERNLRIAQALILLRAANALDEFDDEDVGSTWCWGSFCDAMNPQVYDSKILAGVMVVELHRRRADRRDMERRILERPTKLSLQDQALATHPSTVLSYIDREVTAGRVPTIRGALRAIRLVELNRKEREHELSARWVM
jgi:hypothetical protein